jgi:hypothetical protein
MLELKLGVCSIFFCDILSLVYKSIQKSIQQTCHCNYTIVTEQVWTQKCAVQKASVDVNISYY